MFLFKYLVILLRAECRVSLPGLLGVYALSEVLHTRHPSSEIFRGRGQRDVNAYQVADKAGEPHVEVV